MNVRIITLQIIYYQKNMKIHNIQIYQKQNVKYVKRIIKVIRIGIYFIDVMNVKKIYAHYVNQSMIKIII